MRIILLDTYPVRRGSQVFFEELGESLLEKGVDVKKVYLYKYESEVKIHLNEQDIVLEGEQKHIFEKFPTVQPVLLLKLIKIVNDFKPEIIILNGSRTLKYASFAKPFFKQKTKLIYRIIDSVVFWNPSTIKQFYYKNIILKNIDAAIGVSQSSLNDVIKLYHFKKLSIVIHRCFNSSKINLDDVELLSTLKKEREDKIIILFLGNLTRQKRPERFVETIKLLESKYDNCFGWIVGDGVLKQDVQNRVNELEIGHRIKFWGYQKNVFPFIANADILLLTSDTEGLPGVTLEAGYFKVATVCPNVGGVKEFIENDNYGLVLDNSKPESFADAISMLIDESDLRKIIGENAKRKVIEAFDMEVISKKYIDFIQRVISNG
jgi:glycosyltransferase involved in cell wall biosynthesis